LGYSQFDFIAGVDYAGAATFLPVAQKADVSLFM
jgi:peroxiredoxin family protein